MEGIARRHHHRVARLPDARGENAPLPELRQRLVVELFLDGQMGLDPPDGRELADGTRVGRDREDRNIGPVAGQQPCGKAAPRDHDQRRRRELLGRPDRRRGDRVLTHRGPPSAAVRDPRVVGGPVGERSARLQLGGDAHHRLDR